MKRICHITTVHSRYDVRIFHKECKSLTKHYDVSLIVADGMGDEINDSVKIYDIGKRQDSRLKRARIDSAKAYRKAQEIDADLYHFHDPELINTGLKLKRKGKFVIYDTHEDLPRQIYGKPYLKDFLKPMVSKLIELKENNSAKKFDYVITATPFIRDRFLKINKNTIDINNYPILEENTINVDFNQKEDAICYVGGLSQYRGVYEIIKSLEISKAKLNLAGNFEDKAFEEKCRNLKGWANVNYHGFVSRNEIVKILNKSKIGMVTLPPLVNYIDSLPIKMFEYMLAGIPVIASDFPLWKSIIEDNNCGLCVDPGNIASIAKATNELLNNQELMKTMGANGRNVVLKKFNWNIEKEKLFKTYESVLQP
jgi:glycosyltransferase involved in cell wall biosynthesis